MSFKEDMFAKIVTYITVTILLGALFLEAFYIYLTRKETAEAEQQLVNAEYAISDLKELNQTLEKERQELQTFKDNWEDLVILADNEFCQQLREDLCSRPELIPEVAIQESILGEEADRIFQEGNDPKEKAASKDKKNSSKEETVDSEMVEITADFAFPGVDGKDWLVPLNLGNKPSLAYLFYARAVDTSRGKVIDLLYEVPVYYQSRAPKTDEDGQIIWNCMAYDAGLGWQLVVESETEEETEE